MLFKNLLVHLFFFLFNRRIFDFLICNSLIVQFTMILLKYLLHFIVNFKSVVQKLSACNIHNTYIQSIAIAKNIYSTYTLLLTSSQLSKKLSACNIHIYSFRHKIRYQHEIVYKNVTQVKRMYLKTRIRHLDMSFRGEEV